MKIFISHNKADKDSARALAVLLVEQGVDVWFDEWELRPGDSIVGGIEEGLSDAGFFVLFWSKAAEASNWVGTEVRAFLRRRVDDDGLKIVPLMVDGTKLPTLVADYRGYDLASGVQLEDVVSEMTGNPRDLEIARRLQSKLLELTANVAGNGDPLPYLVCPSCASTELHRSSVADDRRDDIYYMINCKECGWEDWTQ
jgi:hypothetical protein